MKPWNPDFIQKLWSRSFMLLLFLTSCLWKKGQMTRFVVPPAYIKVKWHQGPYIRGKKMNFNRSGVNNQSSSLKHSHTLFHEHILYHYSFNLPSFEISAQILILVLKSRVRTATCFICFCAGEALSAPTTHSVCCPDGNEYSCQVYSSQISLSCSHWQPK